MEDITELRPDAPAQPATLVEYLAIDFGADSALRNGLLSRVEREATQDEIALTDIAGDTPAHFTPEMLAWFHDHVAFHRGDALEDLKKRFAADRPHNGASTCIIEAEREQVEDEFLRERRTLRRDYLLNRRADRERLVSLRRDEEQAKLEYVDLKADLGREPIEHKPGIYFGGLFCVGIAEALINFESFASLPWATPFLATGLTLLVGAAIALAAHLHGKLLKQYRSYFDHHVDPGKRWVAVRMFGIGTSAFLTALASVYYARDAYLAQTMLVDASLGGEGDGGHVLWLVAGSLIGNILVYLVGVILAYMLHDENPRFPELRAVLAKLTARRDALARVLDEEEQRIMKAAETRRKHRLEELRSRNNAQRSAPRYAGNRTLFESLAGQDARVLGALDAYRIALCQQVRARKGHFIRADDMEPDVKHHLTPAQYQQLGLALKHS